MRSRQEEVKRFEELRRHGTPLDETIFQNAKTASLGLEIMQSGDVLANSVYSQPSGGLGIMVSLRMENVSDRIIKLAEIRLRMPWIDASFHWIKKQSPRALNLWGGYVLAACGPCGFDPSLVLNHLLTRDFRLYPGDIIDGLLLGEGTAAVPVEYTNRMLIPMQLVVFAGSGESYGAWVKLGMVREVNKRPEVVRPQGITVARHTKDSTKWLNGEAFQKNNRARGVHVVHVVNVINEPVRPSICKVVLSLAQQLPCVGDDGGRNRVQR